MSEKSFFTKFWKG